MQSAHDRAAANRANAQHSTGPKTPEGKANVKFNALRHGACAQQIVLPGEDLDAYEALGQELLGAWQPANIHELKLVRSLQENQWRAARLRAAETNLLALGVIEHIGQFEEYDEPVRRALAQAASFRANARYLDQISRHETRILKQLREIETELTNTIRLRLDAKAAEYERNIPYLSIDPRPAKTANGSVLQNVNPDGDQAAAPMPPVPPPAPDQTMHA